MVWLHGLQQSEYGRKLKTGKGATMAGLDKPNFDWFGSFGLEFLKKEKREAKITKYVSSGIINLFFDGFTYQTPGPRKNSSQLAKYLRVLCVKPSDICTVLTLYVRFKVSYLSWPLSFEIESWFQRNKWGFRLAFQTRINSVKDATYVTHDENSEISNCSVRKS